MRIVLCLFLTLVAGPAFAQNGERYENDRYGYRIDIPTGFFEQHGMETGDGTSFALAGKHTFLVVFGEEIVSNFDAEVARRMADASDDAWNITDQAITPGWARFSAIKGFRIRYQHMMQLCADTLAGFALEYSVTDSKEMEPVIDKLVPSLASNAC
jgi:hypothetical protein